MSCPVPKTEGMVGLAHVMHILLPEAFDRQKRQLLHLCKKRWPARAQALAPLCQVKLKWLYFQAAIFAWPLGCVWEAEVSIRATAFKLELFLEVQMQFSLSVLKAVFQSVVKSCCNWQLFDSLVFPHLYEPVDPSNGAAFETRNNCTSPFARSVLLESGFVLCQLSTTGFLPVQSVWFEWKAELSAISLSWIGSMVWLKSSYHLPHHPSCLSAGFWNLVCGSKLKIILKQVWF